MKIINIRSPYIISINEAGQTETKIELRIWKPGQTKPTAATYILSKKSPSASQTETIYNVSPFAKDFIENKIEAYNALSPLTEYNYCHIEVKTFYKTDADFVLKATEEMICLNGYTRYTDGANKFLDGNQMHILHPVSDILYDRSRMADYYLQVYAPNGNYTAVYTADYRKQEIELTQGINNIPVSFNKDYFEEGNFIYIQDITATESDCCNKQPYAFKVTPVCELILSPVICSYVNRFGAIQQMTFFKKKTDSIEVTSDKFNLMQQNWDFNPNMGAYKQFNFNGKQSVKINSGFVPESYSANIQDLMMSESVWLDGTPVTVKSTGTELKTVLKNQLINYEIDFEYAFDLINTVV